MTVPLPPDLADVFARRGADWADEAVARVRDLLVLRHGALVTVVACDSNAGIGDLPGDVLAQPAHDTGYGAAKVPLMEVMAAGAVPTVLVNTLGVALSSHTGADIMAGIRECVATTGHEPVITGSDETNIPTSQTSVGVTVIGVAAADSLRLGTSRPGDDLLVVGLPKDGVEVPYDERDRDIVSPSDVATLLGTAGVHELLPVGSRGIRHEASELARVAGLTARVTPAAGIDLDRSAGSSTCLVVAAAPGVHAALAAALPRPTTRIGTLEGE